MYAYYLHTYSMCPNEHVKEKEWVFEFTEVNAIPFFTMEKDTA